MSGNRNAMAQMASKRFPSAGNVPSIATYRAADAAKKASRARKESFKPRPSLDRLESSKMAVGGYAGFGGAVREEDED